MPTRLLLLLLPSLAACQTNPLVEGPTLGENPALLGPDINEEIQEGAFFVGPGDQIGLDIYQNPDLSRSYKVAPDGTVFFHLLGKVNLQGLDADQVRDVLAEKYSRYLVNPSILITLQSSGDRKVAVLGEVNRRGSFQLTSPRTTLLDMIAQAGGVSNRGDRTGILVARRVEGKIQVRPYNMDMLFDPEDPRIRTEIPYVHPGDIVFVIQDAGQAFLDKVNIVNRALRTVQQGERLITTTRQVGRVITGQSRGN